MSLKWSEGTMIKFIELYHNHDCLWNHRLDSYKNKNARDNALCVIAREMGIDGPIITATDVRNKIKTIRTMYKKELTIVLRSKKSGTGTDDVYKPKLFWFKKVDEFLRGVSAQRNSSSNWAILDNQNEGEEENLQMEPHDELYVSATESEFPEENSALPIAPSTSAPSTSTASTPKSKLSTPFQTPHSRKRKAVLLKHDNISAISTAIDKLDKVSQQSRNDDGDEFDAFAKLIAIQLRQLPLLNALSCQENIQTLIKKERLKVLLNTTETYKTASPSPSTSSLSLLSDQEIWLNSEPTSPGFVQQCSYSRSLDETSNDIISQAFTNL